MSFGLLACAALHGPFKDSAAPRARGAAVAGGSEVAGERLRGLGPRRAWPAAGFVSGSNAAPASGWAGFPRPIKFYPG